MLTSDWCSVPDCLSGVAVVKQGNGDMAISNAIGSNVSLSKYHNCYPQRNIYNLPHSIIFLFVKVFDILMCLGLPWFLQTVVISPGSEVSL